MRNREDNFLLLRHGFGKVTMDSTVLCCEPSHDIGLGSGLWSFDPGRCFVEGITCTELAALRKYSL
jgi:hypothetical protein